MSEIEEKLKTLEKELDDLKSKAKKSKHEKKEKKRRMGTAHILKDGELVDVEFDPTQPKFSFEGSEYDVLPKGIFYEKPWHGLTISKPHIFWHEHNLDPISFSPNFSSNPASESGNEKDVEPPTPEELDIMARETSTKRGLTSIFRRPVNISPRLMMFAVGIAVVAVAVIFKLGGN